MCSSMLFVVQSTMVTASIVRGSAPSPTTISFVLLRSWAWTGATPSAATSSTASVATRNAIRMSVLLGVMTGRCSTHPATAASSVLRRGIRIVALTSIVFEADNRRRDDLSLVPAIDAGNRVQRGRRRHRGSARLLVQDAEEPRSDRGRCAAVFLEVRKTLRE